MSAPNSYSAHQLEKVGTDFHDRIVRGEIPAPTTSFDLWARENWAFIAAALRSAVPPSDQRFARITIRNANLSRTTTIEINGEPCELEGGESTDLCLTNPVSPVSDRDAALEEAAQLTEKTIVYPDALTTTGIRALLVETATPLPQQQHLAAAIRALKKAAPHVPEPSQSGEVSHHKPAGAAPCVVVPLEPTDEMMRAWVVNYDSATALRLSWRECRIEAYKAMLAAAPSAVPAVGAPQGGADA